ncbi:PREDICTED: sorting nexin-25-like, partial [Galeopterus variegatus]|uniref:Sorting nexin-25-like n=1 Tax=Galeopterus variegatus TaxID=482537 RepID=A0ABM0SAQ4_GALVR
MGLRSVGPAGRHERSLGPHGRRAPGAVGFAQMHDIRLCGSSAAISRPNLESQIIIPDLRGCCAGGERKEGEPSVRCAQAVHSVLVIVFGSSNRSRGGRQLYDHLPTRKVRSPTRYLTPKPGDTSHHNILSSSTMLIIEGDISRLDFLRDTSPVCGNSHESVQSRRAVISHNMDKALKEVFDYSYRDYILSWYGKLSRDEGQLYHLLSEDFWETVRQLRHRLSHVDMVKVVCSDVVRTLLTHFCDLKAANARHEEQPRPFVLHACLRNSDDEVRFLQMCSRVLVFCLLPSKDVQSLSLRIMLAEILTTKVLKPVVELLSNPDYINQMLLAQLEYREQMNEHHKRAYTYAPSYEEFIKLINSNSDVEFLKQL